MCTWNWILSRTGSPRGIASELSSPVAHTRAGSATSVPERIQPFLSKQPRPSERSTLPVQMSYFRSSPEDNLSATPLDAWRRGALTSDISSMWGLQWSAGESEGVAAKRERLVVSVAAVGEHDPTPTLGVGSSGAYVNEALAGAVLGSPPNRSGAVGGGFSEQWPGATLGGPATDRHPPRRPSPVRIAVGANR